MLLLSPLKGLKLSFQQELHDPVKAVHCIQDFNLTIGQVEIISRQIFRKSWQYYDKFKEIVSGCWKERW